LRVFLNPLLYFLHIRKQSDRGIDEVWKIKESAGLMKKYLIIF
jgi:hypothetical protein